MDEETRRVRKTYNRTAIFYDFMDRMISSDLRRRILAQARGEVLEVGVGTGKNLPYYPPGCRVTGIDFSPEMLKRARAKIARAQVPVKLLEMDAQHLEFPDRSFDTVVATCVFCSVPNPLQGLKEIRRVCKPQGQILLLEHVRSDNPFLGWLMDILDPVSVRFIGPHINRRTVENVAGAGIRLDKVETVGPSILKFITGRP